MSFETRDDLLDHMNAHMIIQAGLRRFSCPVCDKTFTRKYHLERHKTNDHGAASHPQKCPLCGRMLKNVHSLTCHMHAYHNPNDSGNMHICDLCFKGFSHVFQLRRHWRRVHNSQNILNIQSE